VGRSRGAIFYREKGIRSQIISSPSLGNFCDSGSRPRILARLAPPFSSLFSLEANFTELCSVQLSLRRERDSVIGLAVFGSPTTLPPSPSLSPAFSSHSATDISFAEIYSAKTAVAERKGFGHR
jgi:hypothetical protein